MIGLSASRYREWSRRALACRLEDASSCPRTIPQRLTLDERHTMRDLVEGERYRHLSIRSLALLAQRTGQVLASVRTWYAYRVREPVSDERDAVAAGAHDRDGDRRARAVACFLRRKHEPCPRSGHGRERRVTEGAVDGELGLLKRLGHGAQAGSSA